MQILYAPDLSGWMDPGRGKKGVPGGAPMFEKLVYQTGCKERQPKMHGTDLKRCGLLCLGFILKFIFDEFWCVLLLADTQAIWF